MNNEEIMVSICCMTYNQEKYIKQALDSFLMQKTNFKFEIIIHDDCSTDNTTNIIKEYAEKYPDIVVPIYESENQYSKGIDVCTPCWNKSKGKYIALCEGDDYWCSKNKLQIQFDFMEKNNDCSLVTNAFYLLNDRTKKLKKCRQPIYGTRYYSTDEIIKYDGSVFSTASLFYRKKFVNNLPDFYYNCPIGDYPLIIYLSLCGKVYFINKFLNVYRVDAKNSWSSKQNEGNQKEFTERREKFYNKIFEMLNEVNKITDNKYSDSIELIVLNKKLELCILKNELNIIKQEKYKKLYNLYNFRGKIKLFLIRNYPVIYKKIKGMK